MTDVLATLEARGFIIASNDGLASATTWRATKRGRSLYRELAPAFSGVHEICFDGYNSRRLDASGFDTDGVNEFGYIRNGAYLGIHHIFRHYYGTQYNTAGK